MSFGHSTNWTRLFLPNKIHTNHSKLQTKSPITNPPLLPQLILNGTHKGQTWYNSNGSSNLLDIMFCIMLHKTFYQQRLPNLPPNVTTINCKIIIKTIFHHFVNPKITKKQFPNQTIINLFFSTNPYSPYSHQNHITITMSQNFSQFSTISKNPNFPYLRWTVHNNNKRRRFTIIPLNSRHMKLPLLFLYSSWLQFLRFHRWLKPKRLKKRFQL